MKIRCLIERSGPTTVMYAGKRFDFVLNEHGHNVCEVSNPGAANHFLKTLSGNFYEEYAEPEEAPAATSQEEPGPKPKPAAKAKDKEKQAVTEPTKE